MFNQLIGLGAQARCGKDFAFRGLQQALVGEVEVRRFAFADALKRALRPLCLHEWGIDPLDCTTQEKEFLRPLLVAVGETWRQKDPDHWVQMVLKDIALLRAEGWDGLAVVTDCRYPNEPRAVKEAGGRYIHIESFRPPANAVERLNAPLCATQADYVVANHEDEDFVKDVVFCVRDALRVRKGSK